MIVNWILFEIHPSQKPPFTLTVGLIDANGTKSEVKLEGNAHVPEGIERFKKNALAHAWSIPAGLQAFYPIYMNAMNTEHESTMIQIAWIIKENVDAEAWTFNRCGGYTGKNSLADLYS